MLLNEDGMKKLFYLLFFFTLIMFFSGQIAFAATYSTGIVEQYDGPVDAGDIDQKLVRVVLTVGGGGGTPSCSAMNFTLAGFAEVQNIYLYTTDQTATYTTPVLLATVATPGAAVAFGAFSRTNNNAGSWYYWVVIEAKSPLTSDVKIDVAYTGGTYVTGPPTFSTTDPAGFRFTNRNFKIGTGETYTTVTEAAASISRFDYDGAAPDIFMEMTANYANPVENGPISFTNHTGPANITIRPELGQTGKITGGSPGSAINYITFNNADKITLDGRPGGAGTAREWTIRNTRTAATVANTIFLLNDAVSNTFNYLNVEGEPGSGSGLIGLGTTTGTTGNDNITVSNCYLRDLTAGGTAVFPFGGILSTGTATKANSGILIDNCHFIDIFNGGVDGSACVFANTNSDAWTITNNHFYQTVNLSGLTNASGFKFITAGSGGGYTITGNFIGGKAFSVGGAAYTITTGTSALFGIYTSTSGVANTITGNTIANISYTTTSTTNTPFRINGISVSGSNNNTIEDNMVGSLTSNNSITLTHNGGGGPAERYGIGGIDYNSTGTGIISDNNIGGITLAGTRLDTWSAMIQSSGPVTMDSNTIGGLTDGKIEVSVGASHRITGIYLYGTASQTVTNGIIQNITEPLGLDLSGIYNFISTGNFTFTGNTIRNITFGGDGVSYMVANGGGSGIVNISNNAFQDITLSSTGVNAVHYTIYADASNTTTINSNTLGSTTNNNMTIAGDANSYAIYKSGSGAFTCNSNTIQEYNLTGTGANAAFYGIYNGGEIMTVNNNSIKNIDVAGTGTFIYVNVGIYSFSTASGHTVSNNLIQNLTAVSAGANSNYVAGIYINVSSVGTMSKNMIKSIWNNSTLIDGGIYGIKIDIGSWDVINNVILIEPSGTSPVLIAGIWIDGTGTKRIHHNTAIIRASVSNGAVNTAAIYSAAAGTLTITNNVGQNLRTGTGNHYAIELISTTGTYNFNYLEVANNQNQLCFYTSDNTFAQWNTNTGAGNQNGTTVFDSEGYPPGTFIGIDAGTNILGIVPDDKNGVVRDATPWMGAYESAANSITTSAIAPTTVCRGGTITIAYTITGTYNAGNVFTSQLSNAAGSFVSPTGIGNVTATTNTSISATIPIGTTPGTGYRIRVVSTNVATTGTDNGSNLTIPADGGAGTWTWVGGISTDWFDRCNWDRKSLPDASSDVIIPGGTVFEPSIAGSTADCNTIIIDSDNGGRLNLNSPVGILDVTQ